MKNNILIKNFFEGKFKLWKAYWLVGELLNGLFLLFIFYLEIYFFKSNSSISQIPFLDFNNFTTFSKFVVFFWTIFISIGIWRSAENYKGNFIWIILTFIIVAYRCFTSVLILFS